MQNRDEIDGSQRPQTADAPNMSTPASNQDLGGHLGPAGSPVEGADGPQASGIGEDAAAPGQVSTGHLGPAGDPVEGGEVTETPGGGSVSGGLQNTPAKE
jgi:hypothetical protein